MAIGTIVFDLDGTLIDSAPDIHGVANFVLQKHGADPITLEQTHQFIGNGAPTFVTRMIKAQGLANDPELHRLLLNDFMAKYDGATALSQLYPGAISALETLAEAGHKLGLCTNKPHGATLTVLAKFDLARFFCVVIGGDSLSVSKPDPAPLLHVYDQLETSPGKRLYVGDSEVDAETAQRAGVPFALYTLGYRKSPVTALHHDHAFDDFAALPGITAAQFKAP